MAHEGMIARIDGLCRHPERRFATALLLHLFITNDERLSRNVVPGIHFIQSLAAAAL